MSKKQKKLQDATIKQLRDIKSKLDPRTYMAYEKDIYNAVGQSALYKLQGKFEAVKEMRDGVKVTKHAKAKQTNQQNKIKNIEAIKYNKQELKEYHVKGDVAIIITYENIRKSKYNKDGKTKGQTYTNTHNFPKTIKDFSKIISARSESDAKLKFNKIIFNECDSNGSFSIDTISVKSQHVKNISNVMATSTFGKSVSPSNMKMRLASPIKYYFIPTDDKLLLNEGFCVSDQFVGTYSKYIKKLNLEYFTNLCYKVRNEDRSYENKKSNLDYGLEDDDDMEKRWE